MVRTWPAPPVSPPAAGAVVEIDASCGVLSRQTVASSPVGSLAPLSALALVARRPQGLPAYRSSAPFSAERSSLELRLSCTAPSPSRRSRVPHGTSRPAGLPEVRPLRHVQPKEPASFEAEEPPPPQHAARGFDRSGDFTALRASQVFPPGAPMGFALQSFFPSGERPPGLPGALPSCRLALPQSRVPLSPHPEYVSAPSSGLRSHRRVRMSPVRGLDERGPAALLGLLPLQGSPPPRVARPFSPAPLTRLDPAALAGHRPLRLRGSTREEVG